MADEPSTGGAGGAVAEPVRPSVEPEQKPTLTPEEIEKLRAENEAHRKNQAAWQAEIEEARRIKTEAAGPPPTTGPANPFESVSAEIAQYRAFVEANPNDFAAKRMLRQAEQDYINLQWQALWQRESPKLDAAPESYRAKAKELFMTGTYMTAEAAILSAKGSVLSDEEIVKHKRLEADAAAAASAAQKPSTSMPSGSEPPGAGKRKMSHSEYVDFLVKHEGSSEANALIADVDKGNVILTGL